MPSLIEVTRGDHVESRHVVHIAVARADGTLAASSGDPDIIAFWRSCAKPLQAIPSITLGAAAAYGFAGEAHALQCASHNGEARHVETARRMLAATGGSEADLVCGPHASLADEVARAMAARGEVPTRAHNNCSGKHAGMIALARHQGWGAIGYEQPGHPVQTACLTEVARWAGLAEAEVPHATDGCGVPSFVLPLRAMAAAYARLGAALRGDRVADVPDDSAQAARQLLTAVAAHPFFLAGTGRLDTEIVERTAGRVIAKIGAEGVYCAMLPDLRLGVALKVEDGATRGLSPALLGLLDLLMPGASAGLEKYRNPQIRNTVGAIVGDVEPRIELRRDAPAR
jgi:L-asparaginase II